MTTISHQISGSLTAGNSYAFKFEEAPAESWQGKSAFIQDKTPLPAGSYTFRFSDPADVPQMSSWEWVSKIIAFPFEGAEALYKLFEKPAPPTLDSTIPSRCAGFASKLVASPSEMGREFYRLYLRHAPKSGDPSLNWLLTKEPAVGKALLKHPRNDPNGLLQLPQLIGKEQKRVAAESFSLVYSTAMVGKLLLDHPGGPLQRFL